MQLGLCACERHGRVKENGEMVHFSFVSEPLWIREYLDKIMRFYCQLPLYPPDLPGLDIFCSKKRNEQVCLIA